MTVQASIVNLEKKFLNRNLPRLWAKKIVAKYLKCDIYQLPLFLTNAFNFNQKEFQLNLKRLLNGEPYEYVFNHFQYQEINLKISKDVLIPREETLDLAEKVAKFAKPTDSILDLCCGSGIIGIFLSKRCQANISFIDNDQKALDNLQVNLNRNQVQGKIYFSNLFENLPLNLDFDVIVSNPPYISYQDSIQKSVLNYEPHQALFAKKQGLGIIEKILQNFQNYTKKNFLLAMEFGYQQKKAIRKILETNNINSFYFEKDQFGKDRFLFIRKNV